jgi:hypothetical protein
MVFKWTKLELKPRTAVKELDVLLKLTEGLDLLRKLDEDDDLAADVPKHITKDAAGIIRDYLRDVAKEWGQHIKASGQFTLDNVPLDIVVTCPAVRSFLFVLHT